MIEETSEFFLAGVAIIPKTVWRNAGKNAVVQESRN